MPKEICCDNCHRVPTRAEMNIADKLNQQLICHECLSDVFIVIPPIRKRRKKKDK